MIKIYGKKDCKSCDEAVEYCKLKDISYEYTSLGGGFQISEMQDINKTHKSFPMIVDCYFDGGKEVVEYIGTLNHLKSWLLK